MSSPDALIFLNYAIAAGYVVASLNLVYAGVLGYRYLIGRVHEPGQARVIAITLAVLWVGAACFLVGCGWHHVQHAQHLRALGCMHDLCSSPAWASAILQTFGEVLAIGSAVFLISVLGKPAR